MRLSIGQRLNIGFGAVMGLLAVVGGAALWQVQGLVSISDKQAEYAADLGVASQAMERSLLTRMAAKNYVISTEEDDAAVFRSRLSDLRESLVSATAEMQAPARADGVSRINELIDEYESAFNEAQDAIGLKLTALGEQASVGASARNEINAAIRGAAEAGDTEVALTLSEAGQELIMARLEAYKFADTGDRAFLDSSMEFIGRVETLLASVRSADSADVIGEDLAAAVSDVQRYAALNAKIRDQVETQNRLVIGTMDRIGPEVAQIGAEITGSLIEDNDAVAAQAASSASTTFWAVGGAVVFGIGLGVAVSFAIGRSVTRPVQQLTEGARIIAAGDYTKTIEWNSTDELGELAKSFNTLAENGREALQGISHSIEDVRSQAGEFAHNSESLADGLGRQRQETTQVASAVEEMACSIREVAHKSAEVTEAARRSGEQAAAGGDVVKTTIQEINGIADEVAQSRDAIMTLGEKGQKIGEIISVINDIADQTNLLALNAAIEAARAGEHGRGFAVVADEVRKLAERTTEATEDVGRSIRDIQSETDAAVKLIELSNERAGRGVELAQEAGDALGRIVGDSTDLVKLIETIAVAAEQQSGVSTEVARSVDGIRQISEEISETAESSSSGAGRLSGSAETLTGLVTRFKI